MTEVEIYLNEDREYRFTEQENAHRKFALWYWTTRTGEEAAEEAFHISNAPDELLSEREKDIKLRWKGRALSVGDAVLVRPKPYGTYQDKSYLCCSSGWKELKLATLSRDEK